MLQHPSHHLLSAKEKELIQLIEMHIDYYKKLALLENNPLTTIARIVELVALYLNRIKQIYELAEEKKNFNDLPHGPNWTADKEAKIQAEIEKYHHGIDEEITSYQISLLSLVSEDSGTQKPN